jgi:zinc/manganese transport system ATP-binding protein
MIFLQNVSCQQGRQLAVKDVTASFAPGLTAIAGPNGAGKTTLLRAMAGLHRIASGRIEGRPDAREIGFLPQNGEADRRFPLNCADFAGFGAWGRVGAFAETPEAEHARAMAALARMGIADLASRPIARLSSGQFQRLMFARLIVQDARVLLLDEPFTAVDSATEAVLLDQLALWRDEGRIVVAVLHDHDLIREFFPTTLLLARRAVAFGATDDVLSAANRRALRHAA